MRVQRLAYSKAIDTDLCRCKQGRLTHRVVNAVSISVEKKNVGESSGR